MFLPDENKEEILKVKNLVDNIHKHHTLFSGFFSPFARNYIEKHMIKKDFEYNYIFFGGYEQSERVILCLSHDNNIALDDFPIRKVFIEGEKELNHRQVLGSILSLGINRSKIGDILINNKKALIFVLSDIEDYVKLHFMKVGKIDIKIVQEEDLGLFLEKRYENKNIIVSSLRIDSIISHVYNISRKEATQLIEENKVAVNWCYIEKTHTVANEGDIVSVRGFGRFEVDQVLGYTKKGRITINIKRYF